MFKRLGWRVPVSIALNPKSCCAQGSGRTRVARETQIENPSLLASVTAVHAWNCPLKEGQQL